MHRESLRTLRDRVQLFEGFTLTEVGVLLQGAVRLTLSDGEMIAEQGSEGSCMFIMISGAAIVTRINNTDAEQLAVLAPGASLGELGLLDGRPRSAQVKSQGETVVLRVDRADVDQCPLGISRKLYRNLALALARRLRETNELVCASRSNSTLESEPRLGRLVSVKAEEQASATASEGLDHEELERDRLLAYWRTLRGESSGESKKTEVQPETPAGALGRPKARSYADLDDSVAARSGRTRDGRPKKR